MDSCRTVVLVLQVYCGDKEEKGNTVRWLSFV